MDVRALISQTQIKTKETRLNVTVSIMTNSNTFKPLDMHFKRSYEINVKLVSVRSY